MIPLCPSPLAFLLFLLFLFFYFSLFFSIFPSFSFLLPLSLSPPLFFTFFRSPAWLTMLMSDNRPEKWRPILTHAPFPDETSELRNNYMQIQTIIRPTEREDTGSAYRVTSGCSRYVLWLLRSLNRRLLFRWDIFILWLNLCPQDAMYRVKLLDSAEVSKRK